MFKYKYLKRIFVECVITSVVCVVATVALSLYTYKNNQSMWVVCATALIGAVVFALSAVFAVLYARRYITIEALLDVIEQQFIIFRKKGKRYYVYGPMKFVAKFEEILPQKADVSADEFNEFYRDVTEYYEDLAGEKFYRYSRDDAEDIWVSVKKVRYGRGDAVVVTNVTDVYLQKLYLAQSDYYDSASRLLNREAVLRRIQRFIDDGCKCGYLVMLSINGIEKTVGETATESDSIIKLIGEEYKKLECKRVVVGKNSHSKYLFFFAGERSNISQDLDSLLETARSVIASSNVSGVLSASSGCCDYPKTADSLDDMVAKAEFAMYQAISDNSREVVRFSESDYASKQEKYNKVRAVHEVLDNNSVDYYFQPIVNARNGSIFAYEALMRPVSEIKLSPLDVLEVAKNDNCLLTVERMTLQNVMHKIEDNQSKLEGKKVFINTMPNVFLPEHEFNAMYDRFAPLFANTVMEITEEANFEDGLFNEYQRRCDYIGTVIALDDFGCGYSNESNLIKFQPEYVKIDRSLISNIDNDEQKRTLVSGMVSFAKKHNIKIIAEGVETREEMAYVISVGIDFIQGYYTARPLPVLLDKITEDVVDEIVSLNLKNAGRGDGNIFETTAPGEIDLVELALSGYTGLYIKHSPVVLIGQSTKTAEVRIDVQDDLEAEVTIRNCSVFGGEFAFHCGNNSKVKLNLKGNNKFFGGFYVPVGAELNVTGDGTCDIAVHTLNPIAFGTNSNEGFGKIIFEYTGKCSISMVGNLVIGFGGVYSSVRSEISIRNADITFEHKAQNSIAIGALSGNSMIEIRNSKIKVSADGDKVLGIGNISGTIDAELSHSDISIFLTGDSVTAVGIVNSGNGSINITDECRLEISEKAKLLIGVGTRDGQLEAFCYDSIIDIYAEGNMAIGIGDVDGETDVYIKSGSIVCANIRSAMPKAIATGRGRIFIDSGNIITDAEVDNVQNSRGEALKYYRLKADNGEIVLDNYDNGDSGCYIAPVYDKYPEYIGAFLPEGFAPDELLIQ